MELSASSSVGLPLRRSHSPCLELRVVLHSKPEVVNVDEDVTARAANTVGWPKRDQATANASVVQTGFLLLVAKSRIVLNDAKHASGLCISSWSGRSGGPSIVNLSRHTYYEYVLCSRMAHMRSADFFASHPVFTHEEYLASRGSSAARSPRTADGLLAQHLAAGRLLRVKRGLYASVPQGTAKEAFQADPYLVATRVAPDAVVAYHAALQFRGKAYSVWHRYHVLTSSRLRPLAFQGSEYVGVRPAPPLRRRADPGGGVVEEAHGGGSVRVATLERTLVDLLDAPALGGGWEEIWRSLEMVEYFDLDAVVAHAVLLESALTAARVGLFLEQHREALFVEEKHLRPLRDRAPRQARYLDRTREKGRLVKAWNLLVPERVLDRSWAEVA